MTPPGAIEATAEMTTGQHDATGGDKTTYGEAYHYADNFLQKGDKEAAESGAFYARIRHERYLNEQAILKGQSTSSLLMPGLEIRVQGDDAPAVFRKGVLITGVTADKSSGRRRACGVPQGRADYRRDGQRGP